jgi:hypothetical protein
MGTWSGQHRSGIQMEPGDFPSHPADPWPPSRRMAQRRRRSDGVSKDQRERHSELLRELAKCANHGKGLMVGPGQPDCDRCPGGKHCCKHERAAREVERLAAIEREHFGDPDLQTGVYATPAYVAGPCRMPRWLGRLLCHLLPHRWFVNGANNWRCCGRCRIEQTRGAASVWKD